jgi:hypothetical protein
VNRWLCAAVVVLASAAVVTLSGLLATRPVLLVHGAFT